MTDDWTDAWRDAVDAVDTDFAAGEVVWGADAVERSTIRRYLEPLELDCPLHADVEVAQAFGYDDVTMPYTGILSWTVPPFWEPGEVLFSDDARDTQPVRSPISGATVPVGPRTEGFFATDIEMTFTRPVVAGERLGRRGRKLVSCVPKETAVGRGAFLKFETEIVTQDGEVVATLHNGVYAYDPHPRRQEAR